MRQKLQCVTLSERVSCLDVTQFDFVAHTDCHTLHICVYRFLHSYLLNQQTNDEGVVRVLGSHDKNEVTLIAAHYLETYGRTLVEALKSELSGNYKQVAIEWVGMHDPLDMHALKTALHSVN